jgi:hypothetical protein
MSALSGGIWNRVGLLVLAAFLGVSIPSAAQGRKLYPVDEGKRNPSFRAFRQKLITALRRRDRQFVLGTLHPEIVFSFVSAGSSEGFKKEWNLHKPGASWEPLRRELLRVLSLGGSFDKGEFWAPYVYSEWPDDPNDPDGGLFSGCILGRRVPVRSRPSPTAPIITRLSYDIVKMPEWTDKPWVKIITPGGRRGYVASRFFYSSGFYRAGFKKVKGKWKMMFFIAGD